MLRTDLPQLQRSSAELARELDATDDASLAAHSAPRAPDDKYANAILAGEQKYTDLRCPVLAIYALGPIPDPAAKPSPLAETDDDRAQRETQIQAFEAGVPHAKIVRIKDANHYVFQSNEAEAIQAMNDFLATLTAAAP